MIRIALLTAVCAAAFAVPAIAADTPAAPTAAEKGKETVCRREKETGSLVKAKKTCHTRDQWAYIDDTNQKYARDMADDTRTRAGGN
ncbi:hypothetical protein [Sandarakinorhabdus sp.]|uniref:hypothetical protein n=1 Tax=Sandarakinorhabdus sp. TaxID=1916663 RepID=UPI00286E38A1|nr:hypothetical protein [Sandarakinorhabdus sp.]